MIIPNYDIIDKYYGVHALSVGNNTITHNLNISVNPYAFTMYVRNDTTGDLVDYAVLNETANSLDINVNSIVTVKVEIIAHRIY